MSDNACKQKILYSDIVVVGGGIAGISAAAKLSASAKVTVVEAESHTAFHSTGRSAAIFIENYGNSTLRTLNKMSLPELSGEQGAGEEGDASDSVSTTVLSKRGELLLVGENDDQTCQEYLDNSSGIEHLTAAEAIRLVPCLKPDTFVSALFEPDASDIDVDFLLSRYLKQLKKNQGVLHTDARVHDINYLHGCWQLHSEHCSFAAPIMVNAAGAWADVIAQLAGLPTLGLSPCRRSMAQFDVTSYQVSDWPLFGSVDETWYAKPQSGKLLLSPADEDPVQPHDAWPEDETIAAAIDRFEQMTDLQLPRPSHRWAGLRTFASDRTPVVGEDPLATGFYWLAGQGGYGIQTAPALSSILCSQLSQIGESKSTSSDKQLSATLSPARFR